MNRFDIYSKRLMWGGAFLLAATMAGCGGGGGDGGSPPAGGGGNPPPQAGPAYYNMGAAASFGAGSGNGVTNQGTNTVVTGDLGTTAGDATITGFHDSTGATYTESGVNAGAVSGTIYTSASPAADAGATAGAVATALSDASTALSPATLTTGTEPNATTPGELGGVTLTSGVYASPTLQITGGDLTLDAQGNPDAFWVFQSDNTVTVGDAQPRSVILANGALAKNVFWRINGGATINAVGGGTMVGTIITSNRIDISSTAGIGTNTTLNGRAFVFGNAPVTMVNTIIMTPAP